MDIGVNSFREELIIQEVEKLSIVIKHEVECCMDSPVLRTLYFDGASFKEGSGAGVVFISPEKNTFRYSSTLKFSCTNNIEKYEALLLGLKVATHHGIKKFHAIGDSKLVISWITETYASKNKRLKQYRNAIWDQLELFDAFGISWKDRSQNKMGYLLANVEIKPKEIPFAKISQIEVQNRPSIPENIENWQVFEDDKDISNFMLSEDKYHGQEMDCSDLIETIDDKETIFGQEIMQLKTNKVPKGLVALENIFDNQDRVKPGTKDPKPQELEEINLGTDEAPKKVYIGQNLSAEIKKPLIDFLRKYRHIFSWSYDDLKDYREDLFQHVIPLKDNAKPFRHIQRPVNPTVPPKMQEELMKLRDGGIINPIRHSIWVSNLVPVRKKNGDIRLCVDFRNLNRNLNIASLKDNYGLPNMEAIL